MSGDYSNRGKPSSRDYGRLTPPPRSRADRADGGGRSSRSHYDRDDRRDRDRGDRGDRRDRDRDRHERRRSRSPRPRRDYEVDTYSSSRDYREREREDTYARRERRDDRDSGRGWRNGRDPRRDDDRGYGRRDRDSFDDRRGGGHRGGRGRRDDDREAFGGRGNQRRSPSPVKKKEPTPDLTGAISIQKRVPALRMWDIKPGGYENITSEQAKLSGMFPLPGAPRTAAMDPAKLKAFTNAAAGSAAATALSPMQAKQAKRLFVYNLPQGTTPSEVVEFFNLQMNGVNLVPSTNPAISANISDDKTWCLVDFKTTEDATYGYALNGIAMERPSPEEGGLDIRRPKNYITPTPPETKDEDGVVGNSVPDGPNKIAVINLPIYLDEPSIQELLSAFGELKAFALAKDTSNDQSRGILFCRYDSDEATAIALEGLTGMALGDDLLKAFPASRGLTQAPGLESGVGGMTVLASTKSAGMEKSRVVMLLNIVTPEELMDPAESAEIEEDVKEECSRFGTIEQFKMPRPRGGSRQNPGVGKVYVKYDNQAAAQKCIAALAGRKFSERTVVVTYFPEEQFDVDAW